METQGVQFGFDLSPALLAVGQGWPFAKLWAILLELYDELKGIDWQWQALDSATAKAPLGYGLPEKQTPSDH